MLKMLCAKRPGGEDVVRTGKAWAASGLGIGIVIGLQGGFGSAKFCSGGSCGSGARFEAWLESGIRYGPHWQGGVVRSGTWPLGEGLIGASRVSGAPRVFSRQFCGASWSRALSKTGPAVLARAGCQWGASAGRGWVGFSVGEATATGGLSL